MKTLFKFALAIVSLVLVVSSCSKDPAPVVEDPASLIVGEWNCVKDHRVKIKDGEVLIEFDDICKPGQLVFIFNSDKTYKLHRNLEDQNGVITKYEDGGTWEIENKNLNLVIRYEDGDTVLLPMEIKTISDKELVLYQVTKVDGREFHDTYYCERVK